MKNYFSRAKIKVLTFTKQVNVRTSDRVSDLRTHYPNGFGSGCFPENKFDVNGNNTTNPVSLLMAKNAVLTPGV